MKRLLVLGLWAGATLAADLDNDLTLSAAFATADTEQLQDSQAALVSACEQDRLAWVCYRAMLASYHLATLSLGTDTEQASDAVVSCARLSVYARTADSLAGETDALLSGCYGLSMAINPAKGMSLGPKSAELIASALRVAADSPRVHYFTAQRLWRTPPMWGGNVATALEHSLKAQALINDQPKSAQPQWGHSEIAHQLAQIEALGKGDEG